MAKTIKDAQSDKCGGCNHCKSKDKLLYCMVSPPLLMWDQDLGEVISARGAPVESDDISCYLFSPRAH